MIDAGEIGEPQMLRLHVGTGKSETQWKVPLSAWLWRINEAKCGGGPLIFDHGYHLFSLAHYLMGPVERVYAWMDTSPVGGGIPRQVAEIDAPATIMFQFKSPRRYGVLDFSHTPDMLMDSIYYADDDRVEVIGERGILFVNRCTARTVDLPELMMFRDGKTTAIPVERVEWHDSFIACTRFTTGHFFFYARPGWNIQARTRGNSLLSETARIRVYHPEGSVSRIELEKVSGSKAPAT